MFLLGYVALVVLGIALVAFVWSTVALFFGSVDRRRVERFALRQALVITADNGNTVIRYLATTRRWRGGLLYLVLVVSFVWVVFVSHEGNVNLLEVFCGWFVGAVIAEWRVDALARGPHAAALLHRRRVDDYVRQRVLVLAAAVWLIVPVLGVIAVVVTFRRAQGEQAAGVVLGVGLIAGVAILLVMRRVLERPQPLAAPDLIEADNAIRGRSLNVLIGCALAIGGYLGASSIGEIAARPDSGLVGLAHLFGFAALPILGVLVARAPHRTPVALPALPLAA